MEPQEKAPVHRRAPATRRPLSNPAGATRRERGLRSGFRLRPRPRTTSTAWTACAALLLPAAIILGGSCKRSGRSEAVEPRGAVFIRSPHTAAISLRRSCEQSCARLDHCGNHPPGATCVTACEERAALAIAGTTAPPGPGPKSGPKTDPKSGPDEREAGRDTAAPQRFAQWNRRQQNCLELSDCRAFLSCEATLATFGGKGAMRATPPAALLAANPQLERACEQQCRELGTCLEQLPASSPCPEGQDCELWSARSTEEEAEHCRANCIQSQRPCRLSQGCDQLESCVLAQAPTPPPTEAIFASVPDEERPSAWAKAPPAASPTSSPASSPASSATSSARAFLGIPAPCHTLCERTLRCGAEENRLPISDATLEDLRHRLADSITECEMQCAQEFGPKREAEFKACLSQRSCEDFQACAEEL